MMVNNSNSADSPSALSATASVFVPNLAQHSSSSQMKMGAAEFVPGQTWQGSAQPQGDANGVVYMQNPNFQQQMFEGGWVYPMDQQFMQDPNSWGQYPQQNQQQHDRAKNLCFKCKRQGHKAIVCPFTEQIAKGMSPNAVPMSANPMGQPMMQQMPIGIQMVPVMPGMPVFQPFRPMEAEVSPIMEPKAEIQSQEGVVTESTETTVEPDQVKSEATSEEQPSEEEEVQPTEAQEPIEAQKAQVEETIEAEVEVPVEKTKVEEPKVEEPKAEEPKAEEPVEIKAEETKAEEVVETKAAEPVEIKAEVEVKAEAQELVVETKPEQKSEVKEEPKLDVSEEVVKAPEQQKEETKPKVKSWANIAAKKETPRVVPAPVRPVPAVVKSSSPVPEKVIKATPEVEKSAVKPLPKVVMCGEAKKVMPKKSEKAKKPEEAPVVKSKAVPEPETKPVPTPMNEKPAEEVKEVKEPEKKSGPVPVSWADRARRASVTRATAPPVAKARPVQPVAKSVVPKAVSAKAAATQPVRSSLPAVTMADAGVKKNKKGEGKGRKGDKGDKGEKGQGKGGASKGSDRKGRSAPQPKVEEPKVVKPVVEEPVAPVVVPVVEAKEEGPKAPSWADKIKKAAVAAPPVAVQRAPVAPVTQEKKNVKVQDKKRPMPQTVKAEEQKRSVPEPIKVEDEKRPVPEPIKAEAPKPAKVEKVIEKSVKDEQKAPEPKVEKVKPAEPIVEKVVEQPKPEPVVEAKVEVAAKPEKKAFSWASIAAKPAQPAPVSRKVEAKKPVAPKPVETTKAVVKVEQTAPVETPKVEEVVVEEPVVEARVEEPVVEAKVEKPVVEAKVEEPVVEAKVEEPVVEAKVEEPVVEAKVEEPVVEAKVEEPVVEAKVEEPVVEAKAEEVEKVEEPVVEEAKIEDEWVVVDSTEVMKDDCVVIQKEEVVVSESENKPVETEKIVGTPEKSEDGTEPETPVTDAEPALEITESSDEVKDVPVEAVEEPKEEVVVEAQAEKKPVTRNNPFAGNKKKKLAPRGDFKLFTAKKVEIVPETPQSTKEVSKDSSASVEPKSEGSPATETPQPKISSSECETTDEQSQSSSPTQTKLDDKLLEGIIYDKHYLCRVRIAMGLPLRKSIPCPPELLKQTGFRKRGGQKKWNEGEDTWRGKEVPLPTASENSWQVKQKAVKEDGENNDELLYRKMQAILNKITVEKFAKLSKELLTSGISTEAHVENIVHQLFDKATTQHHFINMYTDLCLKINDWCTKKGLDFRRVILNQCQDSFEKNLVLPESLNELEGTAQFEALVKWKTKMIGNSRFVAQLIIRKLISARIIGVCCQMLLKNHNNETLETLASFLTEIGPIFDAQGGKQADLLASAFGAVQKLVDGDTLCARVRCLLMDVLDMRACKWRKGAKKQAPEGPMKLNECADKKKLQKSQSTVSSDGFQSVGHVKGRRTGGYQAPQVQALQRSTSAFAAFGEAERQEKKERKERRQWDKIDRHVTPREETPKEEEKKVEKPLKPLHERVGLCLKQLDSGSLEYEGVVEDLGDIDTTTANAHSLVKIFDSICNMKKSEMAFKALASVSEQSKFTREMLSQACIEFMDVVEDMKLDCPMLPKIVKEQMVPIFASLVSDEAQNSMKALA